MSEEDKLHTIAAKMYETGRIRHDPLAVVLTSERWHALTKEIEGKIMYPREMGFGWDTERPIIMNIGVGVTVFVWCEP